MHSIIAARPVSKKIVHVMYNNGDEFEFDVAPFIKTGVSSALNDPVFFSSVRVEDGYMTWPNGYDFCPEFLHAYLQGKVE